MSTPPYRPAKVAAKRRAERRRRTKDIGRYIFAYGLIAILVLGTISSVIVAPVGAPTPAPGVLPTSTINSTFQQLVTSGDQALASGDPVGAFNYYRGYLAMSAGDTQVQAKLEQAIDAIGAKGDEAIAAGNWISATTYFETFSRERSTDAQAQLKYAKALLGGPQPDYSKAGAALERAIKIPNSPVLAEAQALLTQHQNAIATAVAVTPTITGTTGLTTTVVPAGTVTATLPISP
jgi:hypothetical protein